MESIIKEEEEKEEEEEVEKKKALKEILSPFFCALFFEDTRLMILGGPFVYKKERERKN